MRSYDQEFNDALNDALKNPSESTNKAIRDALKGLSESQHEESATQIDIKPQTTHEALVINSSPNRSTACPNSKLVFACTTTKGKVVEVCDSGNTMQYRFGVSGHQPELSLSVPRSEASTFQWDGRGSEITYSVQITNGNTVYEVFTSMDRMSDEHGLVSGINVESSGQHVATLTCIEETLQQDLEEIDLKPVSWQ